MVGEGARRYGVCSECAHSRGYVGTRKLHVRAPARECLGMGCSSTYAHVPELAALWLSAPHSVTVPVLKDPETSSTSTSILTTPDPLSSLFASSQLLSAGQLNAFCSHVYHVPARFVVYSQAYDDVCGHRARACVVSAFRRQSLGLITIHSLRSAIYSQLLRYANTIFLYRCLLVNNRGKLLC